MTIITGTPVVCVGSATALTDATAGGTWSSSAAFTAGVGSNGIVTGVAAGTANISYAIAGCTEIQVVTVNPLPSGLIGATSVCTGSTTTLSNLVSGGLWSSSNGNATVGSTTGIVSGITAGTSIITYAITGTGCNRSYTMTINQSPTAITGANTVCVGSIVFASDASSGGISWTSGNTAIATITNSGAMTGVSAGTTTITYTVATLCTATEVVTVNATPAAGTISGTLTSLISGHSTLSDAVTGGVWTSSNTVVATIGSASGITTGINAGTTTITYLVTNSSSCYAFTTAVFSVTASAPHSAGSGTADVVICVGSTIRIDEATAGGAWSSSNEKVATIDATGAVSGLSAGSATISYRLVSGFGTNVITTALEVDALPRTVTIITNPGTSIGAGETVTLNATAGNAGDAPAYQWLINGETVPGATSAEFVSSSLANNDSVTCEIISSGTCSGYVVSGTVAIKVNGLGVEPAASSIINIHPNPSNGSFTVKGNLSSAGNDEVTLEVTDVLGQVVSKQVITAQAGIVNEKIALSSTLANGIYLLNLRTASENKTLHFVIEK